MRPTHFRVGINMMIDPTPDPVPSPILRANVYVDGFNLYHSCFDDPNGSRASWRQSGWLDLGVFCANVFAQYQIHRIRYFTSLVTATVDNPHCTDRKLTYIRALETIPHLSIHRGYFSSWAQEAQASRSLSQASSGHPTSTGGHVLEKREKGSDVNLASHLILDGARGDYDVAIIVSNDSDLAGQSRWFVTSLVSK